MAGDLVLVAGATGALGRHAVNELKARGYRVRAAARDAMRLAALGPDEVRVCDLTSPATLDGIAEGCRYVLSAAGARMTLGNWGDRSGFTAVDDLGNRALLEQAKRARVERFVYVSLAGALALRRTEYAQTHERFVNTLAASGISHAVVRPTGLFSFFLELQAATRRGPLFVPGDGCAKTNPIHERDAARACVEALSGTRTQMAVGGPETFTRQRLYELAFESLSKRPDVRKAPGWLFRAPLPLLRLAQPRLAALFEFGLAVNGVDVIAPSYGEERLGDYLRAAARAGASLTSAVRV